jgi:ATP-dependent DNA helicase RecQ
MTPEAALGFLVEKTTGMVCKQAIVETASPLLVDGVRKPALAYSFAWLQVAGANSVLPPWVRYRFPEIATILTRLRETPCGDKDCRYCLEQHNPEINLERFFGFTGFREKPSTPEGDSLQRAIAVNGMRSKPLLAILPTGGGKSVCYQLPALVRHRCRGLMTVVISPLQALMKDQVDNLMKMTGTPFAAAISGLLTPPERGEVLERIRLGDVAILYIAPEQLRSRSVRAVLSQREIGCWVFDEAHCVSVWGHDFRPDYLYAARFIREFAIDFSQPVPPVCCFTATAKSDVIQEIIAHFREGLGQDLKLFAGGVERENLVFEVQPVGAAEKFERTFQILSESFKSDDSGSAIVYAETRHRTQEICDFLRSQGMDAEAFHGGLDAKEKRDIMDSFVAGRTHVICATSAFGMGIDKADVRLVLHFEMPGSLENYIQEAGRAGRDGAPARCVLLYDPADANLQFRKGAMSEVKKREIERILRALRRAKRNRFGEIVITSDELLRDEDLAGLHGDRKEVRDTKVKTAVAWLERGGFLSRDENLTEVFQGKPVVKDLDEARAIIARLNLPKFVAGLWENILHVLFNSHEDRTLSADDIAEGLFHGGDLLQQAEKAWNMTPAQIVIQVLHDMAEARLIDRGIMLTAILRPKGKGHAMRVLQAVSNLEQRREKFLGSGFFLGTIHSTKGMEFPHVVILDGGWGAPGDDKQAEEERRNLYVAMTRAKETLTLMRTEEEPNPFLKELRGDALLSKRSAVPAGRPGEDVFRQYEVFGLNDVYMDYAGTFPQSHSIHSHLSRIQAGEEVFLAAKNSSIEICDNEKFCVGKLSNNASSRWKEKLGRISEVRVVAMVKRDRMDPRETFIEKIKAEMWEVPMLEIVFA